MAAADAPTLRRNWRTGEKFPRLVFAEAGTGQADDERDDLVGLMESPELAALVVREHNREDRERPQRP
jgi:hypothetical protein